MRLAFVTNSLPYPPEKDGQALIAYHLLTRLSQRHQIRLLCFGDKHDLPNIKRFTDLGISVKLFDRPKRLLPFYYLSPKSRSMAWFQYQLYTPEMIWEVETLDGRPDVDLVYFHSPFISAYLKHISRTPVVFGYIDAYSSWYEQFRAITKNPLRKIHYRFEREKAIALEQHVLPALSETVVVSDVDRKTIQQLAPTAKVSVIANGVDLKFFRPSESQPDNETIVFTGTMNFPPNVRAVLDFNKNVWPSLKQAHPRVQWYIVGKNPTLDIFELQSLDPQIIVTDYVKDIRCYLWRSAVYVSAITLGAGFKNKIVEAMACGKAIVATPTSLAGLPISDGENIFVANSSHEMYEKIHRLFESSDLRQKVERQARIFAEQYDWNIAIQKYESIFIKHARPNAEV